MKVSDPLQAAAFANAIRCQLLLACGKGERSLSDLHYMFGHSLSKLHYHLGPLLESNLLRVSRVEPRAGRPIRFYRAVAERFLVPQESIADLPGERWALELRELLARNRGPVLLRYSSDPHGRMTVNLVQTDEDSRARIFEGWRVLHLSPDQRSALAADLADILARYARLERKTGAEPYLAHAAFAPRLKGTGL